MEQQIDLQQIHLRQKAILSGKELMSLDESPDNYLIEGMLWEHNNIIILAKQKAGKSIFSLQMACALSCGESFLGEYEIPEAMDVLYIQTESTRYETIQRLRAMTGKDGVGWDANRFFLMTTYALYLDMETGYRQLKHEIDKTGIKPRVIFIDPLYMSMLGGLSDETASRATVRNMRRLGFDYDCTIVVIHHEHRAKRNSSGDTINEGDQAMMGSFVWSAFPNHILHLKMLQNKLRVLSCETQRSSRVVDSIKLELNQPFPLHYSVHGAVDRPGYVDTVYNWMLRGGQKHCQQISEETKIHESSVKKALGYLSKVSVNKIKKVNAGRRPTYYEVVV